MHSSDSSEESITGINIAPLVDVILVLLIIFMATAPLIQRRAIAVNVPKAAHSEAKATETLKILFSEKREVLLEDSAVTLPELQSKLQVLVAGNPRIHVALLADEVLPYGEVVEVLDSIRGAGVKKLALEVRSKPRN